MPFASTVVMVVLLAAMGALLVLVLVLQHQLELLVEQPPPAVIHLLQPGELSGLAQAAWQVGGSIRADGRPVPPGSLLYGTAAEVDLGQRGRGQGQAARGAAGRGPRGTSSLPGGTRGRVITGRLG
jgi:hypothetical protein